jgi:hypothetical protein
LFRVSQGHLFIGHYASALFKGVLSNLNCTLRFGTLWGKVSSPFLVEEGWCYDVAVAQINYPSLKHNTQDSIEQARGWSHKEGSSQIFMLDDMQFRGLWTLSRLKQKKIENYQVKLNKIKK